MTQRVPSTGYYDNIIEDHSYTMFSMYPPTTNVMDWQLMKEENGMVREGAIDFSRIESRARNWEIGKLSSRLTHVCRDKHRYLLSPSAVIRILLSTKRTKRNKGFDLDIFFRSIYFHTKTNLLFDDNK